MNGNGQSATLPEDGEKRAELKDQPTRLYSGIQPTGDLHIGNYLGAVSNWAKLIPHYDCIYCVVDYHAITIDYQPDAMREAVLDTATMGIACGLDPERCTLFVQSHVT